MKTW
jgi:hypothetical protein